MNSWAKYKVGVLLETRISQKGPMLLLVPETPPQRLYVNGLQVEQARPSHGKLVKTGCWAQSQSSDSAGLGWSQRVCISLHFPPPFFWGQ